MTPQWSCGLRTLHGSLKVIQGWPVSKSILSMSFQRSRAGICVPVDLAIGGHSLVLGVALLEGAAVELVEVGDFVGAEERPGPRVSMRFMKRSGIQLAVFMSWQRRRWSPVFVAELEEVLDVVVPGFQVGAAGAAAFAALVDGDELVVVELEERDDALAISPLVP